MTHKKAIQSGILALQLCIGASMFGQEINIVPAENFPKALPVAEGVKNLEIQAEPVLAYTKDIVYVNRDGLDLHLQVLAPRSKQTFPCIVYIQGSAWMKQNVYVNLPQLAKFAARGYVIVSVEYRHSEIAPFPAQVQDAKTAIRFVRKNASRFKTDPDNIFLWGDSSGGHTAVLAGITSGNKELDTGEYQEFSDEVNAIIDYYGPSDIVQMNFAPSTMNHSDPGSPEGMLIGRLEVLDHREKAQNTNPINYITREKTIPPILIAHGDMDRLVPLEQSDLLVQKLQETGKIHRYFCLNGADHGTAEFWSGEMYDIVENFIETYKKQEP